MEKKKIGVLLGSQRKQSYCRQIAEMVTSYMDEQFEVKYLNPKELNLYRTDWERLKDNQEWQNLNSQLRKLDGVLYVAPEYNKDFPPVIEEILKIREAKDTVKDWGNKPSAVIAISTVKNDLSHKKYRITEYLGYQNIQSLEKPTKYIETMEQLNEQEQDDIKKVAASLSRWMNRF